MSMEGIVLKTDILIAHPGKHHVLNLVAGCIKTGASVQYITPFYRCGLGALIALLPGSIGNRAKGYFHVDIPLQAIVSPLKWQLIKLWALYKNSPQFESAFDHFVANEINQGKLVAKIVVTLQDYMPETVRAAKNQGAIIWSDQISNQSEATSLRIVSHEQQYGLSNSWQHSEKENDEILANSDVITVPSAYCLEGIQERLDPKSKVAVIPYGANADKFSVIKKKNTTEIVILARAQSVRKGGHLFLRALNDCGTEILNLCAPKKIRVIILGNLEPELSLLLHKLTLPDGLTVEHGNVAHFMVPTLYQKASLFVMPSLSEGRSLACLEAMHSGLPLIITPYCGVDGFKSGEMGYEISDTAESLAIALINAFKYRQYWGSWGANGSQLAVLLTWSEYELAVCRLIKDVLA
jgi:glycosyltransferase involved in cell wall biosynthesis